LGLNQRKRSERCLMCIPPEHYHDYVLAISEILNSKHIIALLV